MTAEGSSGTETGSALRVLVSAASRHGAAADIAQAIAAALTAHGLHTTVLAPAEVGAVEDFDAVILGSAVYAGHWLDAAKDLVNRSRGTLAARPVWLFSSGPVGDPSRKLTQTMGQDQVDIAGIVAATHARAHKMFPGRLEPGNLTFLQRTSLQLFRGLKGDFRDWTEVKKWADGIAEQLTSAALR
jgi:menaquinone-dependent protoporphyrinogen oxidase